MGYFDFGFDHKRAGKPALQAFLDEQGVEYGPKTSLGDLVVIAEKYTADVRERDQKNPKDFVEEHFSPWDYTIPQLRQVLSQYDVSYAGCQRKDELVETFEDVRAYLKACNGIDQEDSAVASVASGFSQMAVHPHESRKPGRVGAGGPRPSHAAYTARDITRQRATGSGSSQQNSQTRVQLDGGGTVDDHHRRRDAGVRLYNTRQAVKQQGRSADDSLTKQHALHNYADVEDFSGAPPGDKQPASLYQSVHQSHDGTGRTLDDGKFRSHRRLGVSGAPAAESPGVDASPGGSLGVPQSRYSLPRSVAGTQHLGATSTQARRNRYTQQPQGQNPATKGAGKADSSNNNTSFVNTGRSNSDFANDDNAFVNPGRGNDSTSEASASPAYRFGHTSSIPESSQAVYSANPVTFGAASQYTGFGSAAPVQSTPGDPMTICEPQTTHLATHTSPDHVTNSDSKQDRAVPHHSSRGSGLALTNMLARALERAREFEAKGDSQAAQDIVLRTTRVLADLQGP